MESDRKIVVIGNLGSLGGKKKKTLKEGGSPNLMNKNNPLKVLIKGPQGIGGTKF